MAKTQDGRDTAHQQAQKRETDNMGAFHYKHITKNKTFRAILSFEQGIQLFYHILRLLV